MVSLSSTRNIPPSLAHPLDPLTASEIRQTVSAIRSYVKSSLEASEKVEKILFNSISLHEPNKYAVLLWAGTFSEKEIRATGASIQPLVRQAEVGSLYNPGLASTLTLAVGSSDRPGYGQELRGCRQSAIKHPKSTGSRTERLQLEGHRRALAAVSPT